MSEFKNQIESARQAYQQQRYPGDLSADVLNRRRRRRVWPWIIPAAAAAVMTGLLFFVGEAPTPTTPSAAPKNIARQTKPTAAPRTRIGSVPRPKLRLSKMPKLAKTTRKANLIAHMPRLRIGKAFAKFKKESKNEVHQQKKPDRVDDPGRGAGAGGVHHRGAHVCA